MVYFNIGQLAQSLVMLPYQRIQMIAYFLYFQDMNYSMSLMSALLTKTFSLLKPSQWYNLYTKAVFPWAFSPRFVRQNQTVLFDV